MCLCVAMCSVNEGAQKDSIKFPGYGFTCGYDLYDLEAEN